MAFSRPPEFPRWADVGGGAGVSVPPGGKQDTGWILGDVPPANWLNWMQLRNYQWLRYLDERVVKLQAGVVAPRADTRLWQCGAGDSSTGHVVMIGKNATPSAVALPIKLGTDFTTAPVVINGVSGAAQPSVIACNNAGRFAVALSDNVSHARVFTSDDGGVTWTSRLDNSASTYTPASSITFVNGLWIATYVVAGGDAIFTSPDATTWTLRTNPSTGTFFGAGFAGSLFCLVGTKNATSPDGVTWTDRGTFSSFAFGQVATVFGKIFAGKNDGKIYSSSDGITFSAALTMSNGTDAVFAINVGGALIAFAPRGFNLQGSAAAYSSDGVGFRLAMSNGNPQAGQDKQAMAFNGTQLVWGTQTNDTLQFMPV